MDEDKKLGIDHYIQQIAGGAIWAYLMYSDSHTDLRLSDLSTGDVALHMAKYAFAAVLIKGVSVKEVAELIKAWRGK